MVIDGRRGKSAEDPHSPARRSRLRPDLFCHLRTHSHTITPQSCKCRALSPRKARLWYASGGVAMNAPRIWCDQWVAATPQRFTHDCQPERGILGSQGRVIRALPRSCSAPKRCHTIIRPHRQGGLRSFYCEWLWRWFDRLANPALKPVPYPLVPVGSHARFPRSVSRVGRVVVRKTIR